MKITLLQSPLIWENPEANRQHFSTMINRLDGTTDLILLPEMFATGFTMKPESVAEPLNGPTVTWMKEIAAANNCVLTGSLVIQDEGRYYNRLLFVLPDGEIRQYDKRHLFSLAGEDKAYTAGTKKLVVEYKGWKICPLICYDLRFPVFARNVEEYDLLLYVANWPEPRITAWDTLLKARAIENMCYVAGVNRVGKDANGHNYPGHSQVFDALGAPLLELSENEGAFTVEIDKEALLKARDKFGFLNDRDSFTLRG